VVKRRENDVVKHRGQTPWSNTVVKHCGQTPWPKHSPPLVRGRPSQPPAPSGQWPGAAARCGASAAARQRQGPCQGPYQSTRGRTRGLRRGPTIHRPDYPPARLSTGPLFIYLCRPCLQNAPRRPPACVRRRSEKVAPAARAALSAGRSRPGRDGPGRVRLGLGRAGRPRAGSAELEAGLGAAPAAPPLHVRVRGEGA
jgi:hypothetical protein